VISSWSNREIVITMEVVSSILTADHTTGKRGRKLKMTPTYPIYFFRKLLNTDGKNKFNLKHIN